MHIFKLLYNALLDFILDYGIYILLILVILLATSCTSVRCTPDSCDKYMDRSKTFKLIRTIITQGTSR